MYSFGVLCHNFPGTEILVVSGAVERFFISKKHETCLGSLVVFYEKPRQAFASVI